MDQISFWTYFVSILFPKSFLATFGLLGTAVSVIVLSVVGVFIHLLIIYWRKGKRAAKEKLGDVVLEGFSYFILFVVVLIVALVYASYPLYLEQNKNISDLENTSGHIRFVQTSVTPLTTKYKNQLKVVIQTDSEVSPFAIGVECSDAIQDFDFTVMGAGMMMMSKQIAGNGNNIAIARFTSPAFKPETPLVINIYSNKKIEVVRLITR